MADILDVQNYGRKLQNQLDLLEDAEIASEDREAIQRFVRHEDSRGGVSDGTIVSNLNRLRLSAERGSISLVEADKEDIDELIFTLKREYGLKDGTLREYRKALRKFYKWRNASWADEIEIGPSPTRQVDPERLLTREEIDELLEMAEHPRDKAVLALLADTGMRIGAVASLRIRDLDLGNRVGTISVNEEANVKNASGSVPLTWSRGYVANWLDIHPRKGEPDAPLIHKLRGYHREEDGGALTYQYLSRRIREIGIDAGIDSEKLNTHNFRKSAITRWIREGLSEQEIKHRAFWVKDSGQFEVYSGVTDEEMNAQIAQRYGLSDDSETVRPDIDECLQCQTPLREDSRYCPGCGAPLTAGASDTLVEAEEDLFDDVADTMDSAAIETLREIRTSLQESPGLRGLLDSYH